MFTLNLHILFTCTQEQQPCQVLVAGPFVERVFHSTTCPPQQSNLTTQAHIIYII